MIVPIGAKAPYGFKVLLKRADNDLDQVDFTTVTECTLQVYRKTTYVGDWETTLSSQTTMTAVATHTCADDGTDFASAQQLTVRPIITLPSGQRICETFVIQPKL
jgi:hypothetical protein